ncbi:helix-turn-helix domain-containing protein, partial [Nocardia neocaledoniensis]|uniref:helix-turn-helix domain-containing protein n=1 Tax=Nocardia neocaledoniensis TaxID=236511 RepID=UPI002454E272
MTNARRTQAERSAATIAKLVEATIEAIEKVGYHSTSLGEISSRAGVSKAAVFRHFDSRMDLVVGGGGGGGPPPPRRGARPGQPPAPHPHRAHRRAAGGRTQHKIRPQH